MGMGLGEVGMLAFMVHGLWFGHGTPQTSRRDMDRLTKYVVAFMFRWNSKPQLLKALGKLAKKASH